MLMYKQFLYLDILNYLEFSTFHPKHFNGNFKYIYQKLDCRIYPCTQRYAMFCKIDYTVKVYSILSYDLTMVWVGLQCDCGIS